MEGSDSEVVIVPMGTFLLELLRHNPREVVAALDYRSNGSLEKAGINDFTDRVIKVGSELKIPIKSIFENQKYYHRLGRILDELVGAYPNAKFIITGNYIPFTRFLIDKLGPAKIQLWERWFEPLYPHGTIYVEVQAKGIS